MSSLGRASLGRGACYGHGKGREEFAQAVERAADLVELANAVEAIARDMGFRYFALTHHVDIPRAPQPAIEQAKNTAKKYPQFKST